MNDKKPKKILILIPPKDFEEEQVEKIRSTFENRGFTVEIASKTSQNTQGIGGHKFKPDVALLNLDPAQYIALFLVGGPGVKNILDDKLTLALIQTFNYAKKWTIGLDNGIALMVHSGVLKGVQATCLTQDKTELINREGNFVDQDFCEDKNIITARTMDIFSSNNTELIQKISQGYNSQ